MMRLIGLIFIYTLMAFTPIEEPNFKEVQLEFERVSKAFEEKWSAASGRLRAVGISTDSFDLLIRAFKFEEDLEVWAKNKNEVQYTHVHTYKFCENVGELGPKRKEGDKQIPEGFYSLSKFNPTSNYHLSLKVDYPNESDSILSDKVSPGGMIFIHGGCKTIGCIPITDEYIQELYVLAVEAKNGGQENIQIHLYPARMTSENMELLNAQYESELLSFWKQLKVGYDLFEKTNILPEIEISSKGEYLFPEG